MLNSGVFSKNSGVSKIGNLKQFFIKNENKCYLQILREGKPHSAYVLRTERQFALLRFPIRGRCGASCVATPCSNHIHIDEWVYRGSERLEAIRQAIDVTLNNLYSLNCF